MKSLMQSVASVLDERQRRMQYDWGASLHGSGPKSRRSCPIRSKALDNLALRLADALIQNQDLSFSQPEKACARDLEDHPQSRMCV
jgi:hypothetical protein